MRRARASVDEPRPGLVPGPGQHVRCHEQDGDRHPLGDAQRWPASLIDPQVGTQVSDHRDHVSGSGVDEHLVTDVHGRDGLGAVGDGSDVGGVVGIGPDVVPGRVDAGLGQTGAHRRAEPAAGPPVHLDGLLEGGARSGGHVGGTRRGDPGFSISGGEVRAVSPARTACGRGAATPRSCAGPGR